MSADRPKTTLFDYDGVGTERPWTSEKILRARIIKGDWGIVALADDWDCDPDEIVEHLTAFELNTHRNNPHLDPCWARKYDNPVVYAGSSGKLHKPDLTADEPAPACPTPKPDATTWYVTEHTHRDGWNDDCGYPDCFGDEQ